MWIYKIKNLKNGKIYIGQTIGKNPLKRIKTHFINALNGKQNFKFHKAIKKYGVSCFLSSILCECFSLEDLNNTEIYFINFYNSIKNGYNIRNGGNNGNHNQITKNKMKHKGLIRYNITLKITKKIEKFIINNKNLGSSWIKKELEKKFNIKCSRGYIIDFIQKRKNYIVKCSFDNNGKKIISELQKKEISQTLKNRNELNRIEKLGMSKKKFFKIGAKCKNLEEFYSYFKCPKSFIINCLKIWTGDNSWYKVFNKQKTAYNKKNKEF